MIMAAKQPAEDRKQQLVIALGPDQAGLSADAEGLQHGDHDGGDEFRRKIRHCRESNLCGR